MEEEKLVSTDDPQNASVTDPHSTTAKECTVTDAGSLLSLTSPEVSEVEHQLQLADVPSETCIVPVLPPVQERSSGEMNMLSMNAASMNAQWQMLLKECEELSVKLTAFNNRLNSVKESCLPTALPSTTDEEEVATAAQTTAKENQSVEMQNTAIKEAVQTFQKFHVCFNEMNDKMKQWVPAIDAAKVGIAYHKPATSVTCTYVYIII